MNSTPNAVGYVRVSTLQQVESGTSVDDQKRIIKKEIEHKGMNLIKIYSDEGVSGKSIIRPALKQMLDDAKDGSFDVILFTKLDRLARNLRDTLNIYHEIKELGIDIICINDPVISTNGPMGSVMLSIMGTFAQFERELIRSRTSAGRINKWKSGEAIMGHLPFGYKKNATTKKIEIDEYKKQIILRIFSLYLIERLSMVDVANKLTLEGYMTPSSLNGRKDASSKWNMNTVREILTNRCYTGESVNFNKYKFIWNEKNNLRKTNDKKPNDEWISLSFPRIIDEMQLEDVQRKITYNRAVSKRTASDDTEKFLTLHVLRCGECRAKLSKQTTGTKKYAYYTCHWRRCGEKRLIAANKKRCDLPFLKYKVIDNQVFNQVINLLANPSEFTRLYAKTTGPEDLKAEIENLSKEKDNLTTKLKKILNIETGTSDPNVLNIYRSERANVEEQFTLLNNRVFKLKSELSFHNNRNEQLEKFKMLFPLDKIGDVIRARKKIIKMLTALPFDEKKKLLDAVISPETGGCIYISRLSTHHLAPSDFFPGSTSDECVAMESGLRDCDDESDSLEKSMVIEMDFTIDPVKITRIIQGLYKNHFNIGKL